MHMHAYVHACASIKNEPALVFKIIEIILIPATVSEIPEIRSVTAHAGDGVAVVVVCGAWCAWFGGFCVAW
jgi:hypothetical protein